MASIRGIGRAWYRLRRVSRSIGVLANACMSLGTRKRDFPRCFESRLVETGNRAPGRNRLELREDVRRLPVGLLEQALDIVLLEARPSTRSRSALGPAANGFSPSTPTNSSLPGTTFAGLPSTFADAIFRPAEFSQMTEAGFFT